MLENERIWQLLTRPAIGCPSAVFSGGCQSHGQEYALLPPFMPEKRERLGCFGLFLTARLEKEIFYHFCAVLVHGLFSVHERMREFI
jgi:hypothetical protein